MKISILTFSPQFIFTAEAEATFDLDVQISVDLRYELNGLNCTVGSSSSSTPGFTPGISRKMWQIIYDEVLSLTSET